MKSLRNLKAFHLNFIFSEKYLKGFSIREIINCGLNVVKRRIMQSALKALITEKSTALLTFIFQNILSSKSKYPAFLILMHISWIIQQNSRKSSLPGWWYFHLINMFHEQSAWSVVFREVLQHFGNWEAGNRHWSNTAWWLSLKDHLVLMSRCGTSIRKL